MDIIVARIANLRRREDLLQEDLVIAAHKGYGATGGTEQEIHDELDDIAGAIEHLHATMEEEYV